MFCLLLLLPLPLLFLLLHHHNQKTVHTPIKQELLHCNSSVFSFPSVAMATIVCQGLQSCLESQLVESTTTLRLKLSSPKTHFFPQPLELALKSCSLEYYNNTNKEVGQKFQASNGTTTTTTTTTQKEKPSFLAQIKSTICDRSLELCTENLGSETGTDITEEDTIIFTMSSKAGNSSSAREQGKPGRRCWGCRRGNSRSFPPPLTTMTGSESLRVRPRREGGRLIIEAVEAPSTHTHFQAERSHGRLRLTLLEDSCSSFNDADSEQEFENDNNGDLVAEDGGVEEEEEMDGNKINVGDGMGSGRINQRPSRCKEGEQEKENGLLNLESYWVASSS